MLETNSRMTAPWVRTLQSSIVSVRDHYDARPSPSGHLAALPRGVARLRAAEASDPATDEGADDAPRTNTPFTTQRRDAISANLLFYVGCAATSDCRRLCPTRHPRGSRVRLQAQLRLRVEEVEMPLIEGDPD